MFMLKKKIAVLAMFIVILFSICACGASDSTQISLNNFVKNWNIAAKNDASGITGGIQVNKKGDTYDFSNTGVSITQRNGYILTIKYTSEGFSPTSGEKTIRQLFDILPDSINEQSFLNAVNEFQIRTKDYVQDMVKGFAISFKKVKDKKSISFTLKPVYEYNEHIIYSEDMPAGMYCFDITLSELIDSYNKAINSEFSDKKIVYGFDSIKNEDSFYKESILFVGHELNQYKFEYPNGSKLFVFTDNVDRVCGIFSSVPKNLIISDLLKDIHIKNKLWLFLNPVVGTSADKVSTVYGKLIDTCKTGKNYQDGIAYISKNVEDVGITFGFFSCDGTFFNNGDSWMSAIPF